MLDQLSFLASTHSLCNTFTFPHLLLYRSYRGGRELTGIPDETADRVKLSASSAIQWAPLSYLATSLAQHLFVVTHSFSRGPQPPCASLCRRCAELIPRSLAASMPYSFSTSSHGYSVLLELCSFCFPAAQSPNICSNQEILAVEGRIRSGCNCLVSVSFPFARIR